MIRITNSDLKSLTWAIALIGSVAKQSLCDEYKTESKKHQRKIRKIYLVMLQATGQSNLDFSNSIQAGIPENSKVGRGIMALTADTNSIDTGKKSTAAGTSFAE